MVHIATHPDPKRREVPEAWLPATAALTAYAVRVSQRGALAVKFAPGLAPESGTAQYNPRLMTIEIDANVLAAGIKPDEVKPNDALFRAKHPLLIGGLLHELAHDRYSRYVPADLHVPELGKRFVGRKTEILVALEESRIEKRLLGRYRKAAQYLPAIALDLLIKEFKGDSTDPYAMSIATALMLLRARAGTITEADVKGVRKVISEVLTDDQIETFLALGEEYHALRFPEGEPLPLDEMESIANRWIEALGDDPEEEAERGGVCVLVMHSDDEGEGGKGDGDGDGSGEGSGEGEGKSDDDGNGEGDGGKALRDAAAEAKHDRTMKQIEKAADIQAERDAAERKARAEARADGRGAAKEAFKDGMPGIGGGENATVGVRSRLAPRKPEPAESGAATLFARKLAKVVFNDRGRDKVAMNIPGKRLRAKGYMERRRQAEQGRVPTAAQWFGKSRTVTDQIPLTVGVAVDISGSMGHMAEPLAVAGYVVGNGVEKAGGHFAHVAFGGGTRGIVRKGHPVRHVPVITPHDPYEDIEGAIKVLDAELNLLDGEGARVLVIASDGYFVKSDQKAYADTMYPALEKAGVVVILLDFNGGEMADDAHYAAHYNPRHNLKRKPLVVSRDLSPREVANLIGGEVVAAVNAEARKRVGV